METKTVNPMLRIALIMGLGLGLALTLVVVLVGPANALPHTLVLDSINYGFEWRYPGPCSRHHGLHHAG